MKVLRFLLLMTLVYSCKTDNHKTKSKNRIINQNVENVRITPIDSVLALVEQTKLKADQEFKIDKNSKFGYSLWSDTIPSILRGNFINEIVFKDINGELIDLSSLNKPIFIQVSATHSTASRTELPVINKLAKEYEGKIKFIILLCDGNERYIEKASDYYKGISIVTTGKIDCASSINIQGFKHSTGYPYNYYLNRELRIINCEIGDLEYDGTETYSDFRERIYNKVKPNFEVLMKETDSE